jgi:hypothetical protein
MRGAAVLEQLKFSDGVCLEERESGEYDSALTRNPCLAFRMRLALHPNSNRTLMEVCDYAYS